MVARTTSMLGAMSACAAVLSMPVAQAQTYTDASKTVDQLLQQFGPQPVTVTEYKSEKVVHCEMGGRNDNVQICTSRTVRKPVRKAYQRLLTVSNLVLELPALPKLEQATFRSIPNDAIGTTQQFVNCTQQPAAANAALQLVASRNASITISKSITNTTSKQEGGFPFAAFGLGGNATVSVQKHETSGSANMEGTSEGYLITSTGMATIPPRSRIAVSLVSHRIESTIPFVFSATVDGQLSANDKKLKLLSSIFDKQRRTFDIAGSIVATDFAAGKVVFAQLEFDEADCAGFAGLRVLSEDSELPPREVSPINRNPQGGFAVTTQQLD